MKVKWTALFDKVKAVIMVTVITGALALLDVLTGFNWTEVMPTVLAPVVATAVAAFAGYMKTELNGYKIENIDAPDVQYNPETDVYEVTPVG